MHKTIDSKIFYFGTPVILISTRNEDGTPNLTPISSSWWLNQSCMIGMSSNSQTVQNLLRERQCVLNMPSADLVSSVDKLALLTARNPVPDYKEDMGYVYERNKFEIANLSPIDSRSVNAPLVKECPIQLEAYVENIHPFDEPSALVAIELKMVHTHVDEELLMDGEKNYIDPEKWKPLIMNFCEFFSLGPKLHPSRLAEPFLAKSREG
ncbi:flavin reductase family protein [Bacillus solimangrovi]|uniref:Flavin reductase n=1 Tax=Bacillus solimangrovi TaxID=1305675 RepID=A0A1E5LHL8_9BACI|nr:flavin reductase family protein [Bacillus solimangrovi]OEH93561.1 flavin reductase [Bacillus solimangrovi]